jgi:ATP-binding cassette subfamily C (CFTR/MRP) protein 1
LDPVTEEVIFRSLLGNEGILRGSSQTVILATHAVHLLSSTDFVILLGETGVVTYQGDYFGFQPTLISQRDGTEQFEEPDSDQISRRLHTVETSEFTPVIHIPITVLDASASDVSRQLGDASVWKYYLKTMGVKHALFFILLGAVCMGFTPAQSMCLAIATNMWPYIIWHFSNEP